MRASIVVVTPAEAESILAGNNGNRKVRTRYVTSLANAMRRGEWKLTHQGIAISRSGRLLDGQHRLMAIAQSGIPCKMLVVTDAPDDSFPVLDLGAKRSLADATGIKKAVAEILRLGCAIATGDTIVTTAELEELYFDVGHIPEEMLTDTPTVKAYFSTAAFRLGAVLSVLDGIKKEEVFASYHRLVHAEFESMTQSEMAISRQLSNGSLSSAGGKSSRDQICRAMAVFSKPGLSKIQVSEATIQATFLRARELLKNGSKK